MKKAGLQKQHPLYPWAPLLQSTSNAVLLVDLDPQANLSLALGFETSGVEITSANVLIENAAFRTAIRRCDVENLDLVPSCSRIESAEQFLPMRSHYMSVLRNSITTAALPYDYILLDCPPALGAITFNALSAADLLIIPTQAEYFSAYALRNMMGSIRRVRQESNPSLAYRILITLLDRRNRTHRNIFEQLQTTFGQGVFTTVIEIDTKLRENPIAGLPITQYKPSSRGSQQYRVLAQELMEYAQEETHRQTAQ